MPQQPVSLQQEKETFDENKKVKVFLCKSCKRLFLSREKLDIHTNQSELH